MPKLFGLDIAGIIAKEIRKAGDVLDLTLWKVSQGTPTEGEEVDGTNPSEQPLRGKGFFDDSQLVPLLGARNEAGEPLVYEGDRVAIILGASLPGRIPPAPHDQIEMEGEKLFIHRILHRDPAAATYTCQCRR